MELPKDLRDPYKIQQKIEELRLAEDKSGLEVISSELLGFLALNPVSEYASVSHDLYDLTEITLQDLPN